MHRTLREQKIHIPAEMENNLQLLHSYNITRGLIKRGENYIAAQLLIRISTNISQFPIHAVPILTSTVVTCTKAGLKASAFKFASLLLQPTYRQKIDEKYKRKIETVVRKSDRNSTDIEMKRTPCPMCQAPVEEFSLSCSECKSSIPYCVVTGRHVTSSDFAMCPSCSFPGFFSEFNKLVALHEKCPMCYEKVDGVVPADYFESQKTIAK
uniref:WD repeat-containing protein 19 n=1 Tax=Ditylenchus dipsaci TaxID=166011 RepID=A0A915DYX9_9BILA